jgi:hypothetical protein
MRGFRASGATDDDVALLDGLWIRVLAVNHVSRSFEDVEDFLDGIVVVIGEGRFPGRDSDDRHPELLGSKRVPDVPAFGAVFRREGGERRVIRRGDVENRWIRRGGHVNGREVWSVTCRGRGWLLNGDAASFSASDVGRVEGLYDSLGLKGMDGKSLDVTEMVFAMNEW